MILKVRTPIYKDGKEPIAFGWTYYDYLKSATVYSTMEDGKIYHAVDMLDSPHNCILGVTSEAFLMNDNGKTIQVVRAESEEVQ